MQSRGLRAALLNHGLSRRIRDEPRASRISFSISSWFKASAHTRTDHVRVLYGSQTGTAQQFATQLGELLSSSAIENDVCDLREFDDAQLTTDPRRTVFIVSCFGRGEPSDSAKPFFKRVVAAAEAKDHQNQLLPLRFSVFGLGSSKTHAEYYNVVGKRLQAALKGLGATPLMPLALGDDSGCIELDFEAYTTALVDALKATADPSTDGTSDIGTNSRGGPAATAGDTGNLAAASPAAAGVSSPPPAASGSTAFNPYHSDMPGPVRVISAEATCDMVGTTAAISGGSIRSSSGVGGATNLPVPAPLSTSESPQLVTLSVASNTNLTPLEPLRPTYELRLRGSELPTFTAGDHVAILPQNSSDAVAALCARLRWDPEFRFSVSGASPLFTGVATVRDVLTHRVALGAAVSPSLLRYMAGTAGSASDAAALRELAEPAAYVAKVRDGLLQLRDILDRFPSTTLPLDRLLSSLPALGSRYYSVSSSPKAAPGELHVTFRHHRVSRRGSENLPVAPFQGACTTYMAGLRPGAHVQLAVRPSSFHLPADPSVPIAMIAGGVGITPFRSFLQDRIADVRRAAVAGLAVPAFGPALLLYGCRDSVDRIYADVAEEALAAGALSLYDVGFASEPRQPQRFADRLVEQHAQQLWSVIEAGGTVYVCGGAAGFGESVSAATKRCIELCGAAGVEGAARRMSRLLADSAYLEDLAD